MGTTKFSHKYLDLFIPRWVHFIPQVIENPGGMIVPPEKLISVGPKIGSPFAKMRPGWSSHIDNIVASGRPKTIVLGEGGGQGKIWSFVNRESSKMTEFLEMRPGSLDYSAQVKALKEAGQSTEAIDAETLEFNLLLIERLQRRGFTFKVLEVDSSAAAKSSWLKAELELLERLGVKWDVIPKTRVEEVMKLPKWRQ